MGISSFAGILGKNSLMHRELTKPVTIEKRALSFDGSFTKIEKKIGTNSRFTLSS